MAMIFAMLIWGLSWSNAKIAGQYADPQLLMFWRFTFAAMTMVPTVFRDKTDNKTKIHTTITGGSYIHGSL